MPTWKPVRFLPYILALLSVPAAHAQYCYVFSNSAAGISVSLNIIIGSQRVLNSTPPGQTRFIQFNYTGDYTETIGAVNLSGSGPSVNATIGYQGVPNTTPYTNLIFGSASTPDTTAGMAGIHFAVSLYGMGDLLPNGLTPTLPPLSAWQYTPPGGVVPPGNHLTINANGVSVTKNYDVIIDSITSCGGGGSQAGKSLGNPWNISGCLICGEPINVGTGNLYSQVSDYSTVGTNQLVFTRYYNSLASSTTALGANWRSNFDRYLNIVSATSMMAERADGQQLSFTLVNGAWTTDSDLDVKLANSGLTWTLTDRDDSVETYTANGNQALLASDSGPQRLHADA